MVAPQSVPVFLENRVVREQSGDYIPNTPTIMSETLTINIKSGGDKKYTVSISLSNTVEDLKKEVETAADVPVDRQRLIYSGKVLKDAETIESYKIKLGETVHMVKSAAPKSASTNAASELGGQSAATSSIPSNIAAGQGAFNPLADLTGARYAGYSQLPLASMFGPDGGMNNTMDPDQLNEMMSNPMFQQSMNSMLSDPRMMDFLIEQNPQLRAMGPQAREMMQSPFFRQMLSNPEMMRQMMSMGGGMGGSSPSFPAPGANPSLESAPSDASSAANASSPGASNPFASLFPGGVPPMNPFAAMMGGEAGAGTTAAPQDTRPPEERYESQLRQLNDMGFFDFDQNVAALRRTGGSVQGAIEQLLNN